MRGSGARNLPCLDARRAHVQAFGGRADEGAHALDVRIPATLGATVGVRDVVPEAGSLAADVAGGSHGALLGVTGHERPGLNLEPRKGSRPPASERHEPLPEGR